MSRDRSLLSSCLKENSNFHEWIWGWIWLGISRFHEVVAGIARAADGAGATPAGGCGGLNGGYEGLSVDYGGGGPKI